MISNCQYHSDCLLKYFCIDPSCIIKTKISCAECQIEGPHKKHDFKSIPLFKSLIGDIAQQCNEYLKKFTEPEKMIQQIKEEFEYMRIYTAEIMQQMESNYIKYIQYSMQDENKLNLKDNELNQKEQISSQQTQLNQLNQLVGDTIKQGNQFLENNEQSYLFNLYHQKEQMFAPLLIASSVPFQQIRKIKVSLINFFQEMLAQTKQILPNRLNQNKNQNETSFEISTFQKKLLKEIELPGLDENKRHQVSYYTRILKDYDKSNLLLITSDHIIRLCNKNTLQVLKELKGHNWLVNDVILIKNSSGYNLNKSNQDNYLCNYDQIISCSADTTIKLWNLNDCNVQQNIKCHSLEVTSIVLFNDTTLLSAGKDYMIYFHEISYQNIEVKQDNNNLLTFGNDQTNQDINQIKQDSNQFEFDENNQLAQNTGFIRQIQQIRQVYELKYLEFPIKQIEKINEVFFIVGYSNGVIALVDFNKRQFMYTFEDQHELGLYCLAKINDTCFCSSGGDRKIKFWDINQTNSITEYKFQLSGYISKIKVLSQNKCIAVSSSTSIEALSFQSLIQDKNTNNAKKVTSKPSFAEKKQLLKVFQMNINKSNEINDFLISNFDTEEQGVIQGIMIGANIQKIQYYA